MSEVKELILFSLFSTYLEVFIPCAYLWQQSTWRTVNKRSQGEDIIFIIFYLSGGAYPQRISPVTVDMVNSQ